MEDTIAEFELKLDEALTDAGRATLAELTGAYVRVMVTEFRRHYRVLQHVVRSARGDVATTIGERVHAFNELAHGRYRELAWAKRREIRHRSPRAAIEVALFIASAAAREAVNPGNWRSYTVQPDDATLIREITASAVAYLTRRVEG